MKAAAVLTFLILGCCAMAAQPISFRQFPAGDSIHVKFTSSGCFHYYTYEFDFHRAVRVTATIARVGPREGERGNQREEGERTIIGKVALSQDEIAGLDRLLAFYRWRHGGGCTTVDKIVVTQMSGGKAIASESFTDASCATYEAAKLTTFPRLAAKLRSGAK